MQLASKTYDAADIHAVQELYHANGWTDGLPIVPPTPDTVQACLEWAMMSPDQLLGIEPVRGVAITAEKLAVNAVMAGCLPMHFPAVVTAFTAMLRPEFLLHGATASTGGCAVFVVLNGPICRELGAAGSFNALGNSDRSTAVIGRAIRLALINILEVRPGGIDRSTLGHPGKYSYCVAEDEEATGWLPLHAQRGLPAEVSAVTVMAAGAPRQIMNEWTTQPEEILETFAAEMRANMRHYSIWGGNYALIIPRSSCASICRSPAGARPMSPTSSIGAPGSTAANGPRSARVRWCANAATPNTPPWRRPMSCWLSRPADLRGVSAR